MIAILCYIELANSTDKRGMVGKWTLFTLSCILSTAFKPSFIVVFGSSVVILRIVAFIRNRDTWKMSIGIGVSFALALFVVVFQYAVLFPSDGSSGIALGFADVWSHFHQNILLAMLQSFAFPLVVLVGCSGTLKICEDYGLAWLMFVLSLAEFLFLHETGSRMYHGNFAWSLSFACFYLMVASTGVFFKKWKNRVAALFNRIDAKDFYVIGECESIEQRTLDGSRMARVYCIVVLLVFALHFVSDLLYFVGVVLGNRPF